MPRLLALDIPHVVLLSVRSMDPVVIHPTINLSLHLYLIQFLDRTFRRLPIRGRAENSRVEGCQIKEDAAMGSQDGAEAAVIPVSTPILIISMGICVGGVNNRAW